MNNRHRRVTKLRKQELNVLKAKFERGYGVSAEEVYKVLSQCVADACAFCTNQREVLYCRNAKRSYTKRSG